MDLLCNPNSITISSSFSVSVSHIATSSSRDVVCLSIQRLMLWSLDMLCEEVSSCHRPDISAVFKQTGFGESTSTVCSPRRLHHLVLFWFIRHSMWCVFKWRRVIGTRMAMPSAPGWRPGWFTIQSHQMQSLPKWPAKFCDVLTCRRY